jgi:hypothetical protein
MVELFCLVKGALQVQHARVVAKHVIEDSFYQVNFIHVGHLLLARVLPAATWFKIEATSLGNLASKQYEI